MHAHEPNRSDTYTESYRNCYVQGKRFRYSGFPKFYDTGSGNETRRLPVSDWLRKTMSAQELPNSVVADGGNRFFFTVFTFLQYNALAKPIRICSRDVLLSVDRNLINNYSRALATAEFPE